MTCKSFGWRPPTQLSTLSWSLVEEVARQAVSSMATDDEVSRLPVYSSGTTSWLSILYRYEPLPIFDVLMGGYIEYRNGDKSTVQALSEYHYCSAASCNYPMTSGSHYAEFEIIAGLPYLGIMRPIDTGGAREIYPFFGHFYPVFLAQRSEDWGDSDVHVCEYFSQDGKMCWINWDDDEDNWYLDWKGMESCRAGDTVGMLLNLDEGTLTVYKNNLRLGIMKNDLHGSYCWFVTLLDNDTVALKGGTRPTGASSDQ